MTFSSLRRWVAFALTTTVGIGAPALAATTDATPRSLSLAQLAGERVIYSYPGLVPPPALLARIKAGEAAGVIFFGDNISSAAQIKSVIGELQRAASESAVKEPLLLMTDQEGGEVRRLPGAPTLSEKEIGDSADPAKAAEQAGHGAGLNLKSLGMNVNLSPVLDVYRTVGNFDDQFQRSYSSNPQVVSKLGSDFIKAQQKTGVAATAKHFPGLGAATAPQDTDLEPVRLNVPLTTLRSDDELPYHAAISAGARLVMVSWATYPALDPQRPAGLSSIIVQKELRQRLRFRGVTITDALQAGALKSYGSTANRALLAAGAGMDLLLCAGQTVTEGSDAVNALVAALRHRALPKAAFTASVARVMALRALYR